ncbi:PREDICTED: uncharacterized protein LOC105556657 [Vollenhovia emeryi]|uniref:uncharacterized protein LOC105556657 n=1 Tax=Vollenhovia emeryi TaxID=411798 RepID=UPI0005F39E48|nr:PREDICTED: uncharacterized protein LOC105556657 [Vollenhovia emeryi]
MHEYKGVSGLVLYRSLCGDPSRWKTFVGNRDNPADIVSRGVEPHQLIDSTLWWQGPDWITEADEERPELNIPVVAEIPEEKRRTLAFAVLSDGFNIFERYSSLTRLIHVIAYCARFAHNTRNKLESRYGQVTVAERNESLMILIKLMQQETFGRELADLTIRSNREIHRSSKLHTLNVFLDKNNVIRVGGRLEHSVVSFSRKHPIVLPTKHRLTELIIRHEHYRLLHAGPQMLLASIRNAYWPLAGRIAIKRILKSCIVCFRSKPKSCDQLMGNLPRDRVTVARPFLKCGVDYAGPFSIKLGRNKSTKAYLCLFVCFTSKAIHLELAVDLSTMAFMNAFRRFISRRGIPSDLYSDNGTNFQGACNKIVELNKLVKNNEYRREIGQFLAAQSIRWHFTPPYTPHFGGIWEAGVKSVKTHLRKIMGERLFTFEELYTLLASIEACLNSRPLCPLSVDPSDLLVLTPGHFLIGEPLTALPEHDLADLATNRLNRYQLLTQTK